MTNTEDSPGEYMFCIDVQRYLHQSKLRLLYFNAVNDLPLPKLMYPRHIIQVESLPEIPRHHQKCLSLQHHKGLIEEMPAVRDEAASDEVLYFGALEVLGVYAWVVLSEEVFDGRNHIYIF
jgi:hypothetical protein